MTAVDMDDTVLGMTPDDARASVSREQAIAQFHDASKPDEPQIRKPGYGDCTMFVGLLDEESGERYKDAVVRELRGSDEEELAKLSTAGSPALLNARVEDFILRRAVTSIGPIDSPSAKQLGELLVGDRGVLFTQTLITTFGEDKDYEEVPCPNCKALNDFTVHVPDYIDYKPMGTPEPWVEVKLRRGRTIKVRFPTGHDQLQVFGMDENATEVAMNTYMLARCILDEDLGDKTEFARNLGAADRRTIVQTLTRKAPSVDFKEVSVLCPHCEAPASFVFGWADLLFA